MQQYYDQRRRELIYGTIFNLENPIWRFIGNLADFFLLSILWYLSCIPVITAGSGTAAMYYVTLKISSNQEGYTFAGWWKSFKSNFKQGAKISLIYLAFAAMLAADFYWSIYMDKLYAKAMFFTFLVVAVFYLFSLTFIFPLLARCENTTSSLIKMSVAMAIRNFLPTLSVLVLNAGMFLAGIFLFWPILLLAPGLSAYINSHIFNRCFEKYNLNLPE